MAIRDRGSGEHNRVARGAAPTHRHAQIGHNAGAGPLRIALYSHDTLGLGHLRRNLLIAQALAGSSLQATNLLITGAHEANFFAFPDRVDCLTLPRLQKNDNGDYSAGQLDISVRELARLRTSSIRVALEEFQPDLLIVDKVPVGAFGELLPALESLNAEARTRCVLGLRDVLDDPQTVRRECLCDDSLRAIDRYYDSVWIYGDANIYDPIAEYDLPPSIQSRTHFTGYLDQSGRLNLVDQRRSSRLARPGGDSPLAVCVVGGGQDGAAIADAFLEALPPDNMHGVIITGPFMPRASVESMQRRAMRVSNLTVLEFSQEADLLIREADHVVAMAGYNTVCSILSFDKRALLVPRTTPRREQLIRAQRLAALGIVDVMPADEINIARMSDWLSEPIPKHTPLREMVDLNGLARLCELAAELLGCPSASSSTSAILPPHDTESVESQQ